MSEVRSDRSRAAQASPPRDTRDGSPAIRFDRVSKRFGPLVVLDQVSFEITSGTAFCLLGRSGTGKSVTLRHIVGLVQPDSGTVIVGATPGCRRPTCASARATSSPTSGSRRPTTRCPATCRAG
jgi:ABC-type glutathione transport system ATPase component